MEIRNQSDRPEDDVRVALSAVLVSSSTATGMCDPATVGESGGDDRNADFTAVDGTEISSASPVRGPTHFSSIESVLSRFATIGFQASHFGQAIAIARKGLVKQVRSRQYVVRDGKFVEVGVENKNGSDAPEEDDLVRPLWFLGMTAQLMGTGCREAVKFLVQEGIEPKSGANSQDPGVIAPHLSMEEAGASSVPYSAQSFGYALYERIGMKDMRETKVSSSLLTSSVDDPLSSLITLQDDEECSRYHSFLSCLVVSGGGMEHDIRRACVPYHLIHYSSEASENLGGPNITANKDHHSMKVGDDTKSTHAPVPCRSSGTLSGSSSTTTTRPGIDGAAISFGNITYPSSVSSSLPASRESPLKTNPIFSSPSLYELVMQIAVRRLRQRQERLRHKASLSPVPSDPYFDQCSWNLTPSEIWGWIGWHLPLLFAEAIATITYHKEQQQEQFRWQKQGQGCHTTTATNTTHVTKPCCGADSDIHDSQSSATATIPWESILTRYPEIEEEARRRAKSTVVYWAAQQGVPIFSPSFVDGDMMDFLLDAPPLPPSPSSSSSLQKLPPDECSFSSSLLAVDLVRDIHSINKMAMTAGRTGVLICGGGVVKHHICNANLMRNGSDYTIFMNNGQEFDGSDAGAKPEEALSWGKIRIDGEHVKVYGEVTTVFPLLVGEVFVDAVRRRNSASDMHSP